MDLLNQWMAWLSVDGNWIPVVVAGVIGLILGWLFTRIPARRHARELDDQISDLNSTNRNIKRRADQAESSSTDLTRQLDNVKGDLEKRTADLDGANEQISQLTEEMAEKDAAAAAISAELDETKETVATLEPQLRTREYDLTNIQSEMAVLQDEGEQAMSTARAELEALTEQNQIAVADIEALRADLAAAIVLSDRLVAEKEEAMQLVADVKLQDEAISQELKNREIALDESFLRAAHMQRILEERETEFANAQTELIDMGRQVEEVTMLKDDMEQRLNHARGNVASELAVLTTTMVKMKDDALKQANRRNAALAAELDMMRTAITQSDDA